MMNFPSPHHIIHYPQFRTYLQMIGRSSFALCRVMFSVVERGKSKSFLLFLLESFKVPLTKMLFRNSLIRATKNLTLQGSTRLDNENIRIGNRDMSWTPIFTYGFGCMLCRDPLCFSVTFTIMASHRETLLNCLFEFIVL